MAFGSDRSRFVDNQFSGKRLDDPPQNFLIFNSLTKKYIFLLRPTCNLHVCVH